MINELVNIGWLYTKVRNFCDSCPGAAGGAGLVNQSLINAVRDEMSEYCRLITNLESQVGKLLFYSTMRKALGAPAKF